MTTTTPIRMAVAGLLLLGGASLAVASAARADALDDVKQAGVINVGVFADFRRFPRRVRT